MITIIDYGMGNLNSIANMIKKIGGESIITNNIEDIMKANKLILPGVGAFDKGMENLEEMNLISILNKKVLGEKVPVLGICLGMQLITKSSEEGIKPGLGWINGETIKFQFNNKKLKIPHMGWNTVSVKNIKSLFKELPADSRFYFVHSYFVKCNNSEDILSTSYYGIEFVSSFQKENIFGVQFHPEKSHKFGMKLLENFIRL